MTQSLDLSDDGFLIVRVGYPWVCTYEGFGLNNTNDEGSTKGRRHQIESLCESLRVPVDGGGNIRSLDT